MNSYKATANANTVINLLTGQFVNVDLDADYIAWKLAGNTPIAADPPDPLTPDQIDAAAAKAYPKLAALQSMTPAQVRNWVDNNVTTLPQAIDAIKTLAIIASILARRL